MKQDERPRGSSPMPERNPRRRALVLLLLLFLFIQFFGSMANKNAQDMATSNPSRHPAGRSPSLAPDTSADEAAIRSLEDRFVAAFNAGNIDAMMKNYIPGNGLVVFDVVPPRQHLGADAYRKAWEGFFTHFRGTPRIGITDLGITVEGHLAFSHSIQHVTGTDLQGQPVDRTVRVTDGYRKIDGSWLIVLEHVSVPVDLKTGKPDINSKP